MKSSKLIIMFLILGCLIGCTSTKETVMELDTNKDGKVDVLIHKKNNFVTSTEIKPIYPSGSSQLFFWSSDGRLLKSIDSDKNGKIFTFYYKNYKKVFIDGVVGWKNELDLVKTYPNKYARMFVEPSFLYSRNYEIVISQIMDLNKMDLVKKVIVLKDFRNVDEYAGPYKGSIVEANLPDASPKAPN